MEYNLSGKVSLDDYIQFNKFHQKQGFLGIFRLIFYPALFIFLAFTFLKDIEILKDIFKTSPIAFVKIFSPLVVLLIFLVVLYKVIIPFMYKRQYNSNEILKQFQNIKINEQCISITNETGNNNLIKSNINKIKYDKDTIYIYIGLNVGYIIKKRFLENENDFEELVNFVKANYGKK